MAFDHYDHRIIIIDNIRVKEVVLNQQIVFDDSSCGIKMQKLIKMIVTLTRNVYFTESQKQSQRGRGPERERAGERKRSRQRARENARESRREPGRATEILSGSLTLSRFVSKQL